jgi:DNA-binding MarR family transcriptional regulator
MSPTTDLARGIARLLLDFADRTDIVADHKSDEGELPPIPATATAQRRVAEVLAHAGAAGLSARTISEYTGVTQMNVYEKLDRLAAMGYVEEVPGTSPKRWRLTLRATSQSADMQRDEFTCSSCLRVHHRSQLAADSDGRLVCRECAA